MGQCLEGVAVLSSLNALKENGLILDAYSIEWNKSHDSSQTKHIATEILVIYFKPLRCGLNYLEHLYICSLALERSAQHWIAKGRIHIVQVIQVC